MNHENLYSLSRITHVLISFVCEISFWNGELWIQSYFELNVFHLCITATNKQ